MVAKKYIPEQGDIVFLDFSPANGHEQKGARPAVVVSKHAFNRATGMALVVPVTSKQKGYPFEVVLHSKKVAGVALVDQLRSVDYRARNACLAASVSGAVLKEIRMKFSAILE